MASYQYINTAGQVGTIDAPSPELAMSSAKDIAPHSGVVVANTPLSAPAAPTIAPGTATPAPTPSTPAADPEQAARDAAAKDLGYSDFNAFSSDVLRKPATDTTKLYNSAYTAAGLDQLQAQITSKKTALNQALGTVNDNPWYDEAFRKGEAGRLQDLANTDIKNLQDDYNARLGNVHDLVTREAADVSSNQTANNAKLTYLENQMKNAYATQAADAKAAATPPKTVSSPTTSNVYRYDPTTKQFVQVQQGVPKATTTKASSSSTAATAEQKTIATFTKALANRTAVTKAKTREQFIRQLQAQFPNINPDDIAASVYKTYPDGSI